MAALQVPFWESWDRRTKSGQSGKVEIAVAVSQSIRKHLELLELEGTGFEKRPETNQQGTVRHSLTRAPPGLTAACKYINSSPNIPRDTSSRSFGKIETGFIACLEYILIGEICLRRATVYAVPHHHDVVADHFDEYRLSAFRALRIRHWGCLPFLARVHLRSYRLDECRTCDARHTKAALSPKEPQLPQLCQKLSMILLMAIPRELPRKTYTPSWATVQRH
jgi:hypothetical protein